VPLDRLLQFVKASPQEEALIRAAYDKALAVSRIDLKDLKTDVIASRIVHIVQKGESNLWQVVDFALRDLRKLH
jgi:hypothetical protein